MYTRIAPYIRIARPDHWFKNIFVVPGVLLAIFFDRSIMGLDIIPGVLLGFLCVCLIASSNYVLNEILDAPTDKFHPEKRNRPLPSGQAKISVAWMVWSVLSLVSLSLGFLVNPFFGFSGVLLWVMGILYNTPPLRFKDVPYLDVLCESVNNPIRLALGWYSTGMGSAPPLSMFIAYWMFGSFLMAAKRFAEYRKIDDPDRAAKYRKSLGYYNEQRLIVSIFYYATLFALMGGYFIASYRFELILAAPMVAYSMAFYMRLSFKKDSPVQSPERLFRENTVMLVILTTFVLCTVLLFWDLHWLRDMFAPWILPGR
ncbi:UbiA prenyltransferase family protein [Desulfonatronum lacustre]|uniref:UbiA prenyltransferase family protein n=1 Tax=Desulfonatronum lacustre TaxID=66849 RepID=UPI00055448BA|nr:UbiA prenyltransferase family protein [Desulfonatronum lacustre]